MVGVVKTKEELSGWGIVEPSDRSQLGKKGVVIAGTLVNAASQRYPVQVFNPGTAAVTAS